MTGFGRAEAEGPPGRFSVELKSVNSRFLELKIMLPPGMGALETALRTLVGEHVERGKVDCRVRFLPTGGESHHAYFNESLILKYVATLRAIREKAGLQADVPLEAVLRLPGAIEDVEENIEPETYWPVLSHAALAALEHFRADRLREGQALAEHLMDDLELLRGGRESVLSKRDVIAENFREKIRARIAELEDQTRGKVEPGRLELEIAMLADRLDVSEELARLGAHLDRLEQLVRNPEGKTVGKALDFLVQEILREINTTSSKLRDIEVVRETLEMKGAVERIREQVQNIE